MSALSNNRRKQKIKECPSPNSNQWRDPPNEATSSAAKSSQAALALFFPLSPLRSPRLRDVSGNDCMANGTSESDESTRMEQRVRGANQGALRRSRLTSQIQSVRFKFWSMIKLILRQRIQRCKGVRFVHQIYAYWPTMNARRPSFCHVRWASLIVAHFEFAPQRRT